MIKMEKKKIPNETENSAYSTGPLAHRFFCLSLVKTKTKIIEKKSFF